MSKIKISTFGKAGEQGGFGGNIWFCYQGKSIAMLYADSINLKSYCVVTATNICVETSGDKTPRVMMVGVWTQPLGRLH